MKPHRVLIVEDEEELAKSLRRYLEGKGYGVTLARDANTGHLLAQESPPDIILLDSQLPGMDGHQLCRILRKDSRTSGIPVILMSGVWTADKDQVRGLEGGADDYLSKPFAFPVLRARIEALLRRSTGAASGARPELASGTIRLDPEGRVARLGGQPLRLTSKEFDLLAAFLSRPGRVLTATQLLQEVWGYDPAVYNDPHTVEVHVSSLRRKLGKKPAAKLVNVIGHGYRWDP